MKKEFVLLLVSSQDQAPPWYEQLIIKHERRECFQGYNEISKGKCRIRSRARTRERRDGKLGRYHYS